MFSRVLVPTDFSECADAVLDLLPALRDAGARRALLLHALDSRLFAHWPDVYALDLSHFEERAQAALAERQHAVERAGLQAEVRVVHGSPAESIVAAAAVDADLILMGSRRKSFLRQVVLGSVSENVTRHAPVPVLLAKVPGTRPDRPLFEHVLFPTDFSPCALKAFGYLTTLARGGMRRATLLHVQDVRALGRSAEEHEGSEGQADVDRLEQVVDMDRLVEAQRSLSAMGVEARVLVREGLPFREILRAADEEQVTAIVLGSHGKSSLAEILLGSVSAEVARQAHVPVLVVRRDLAEEDAP